MELTREVPVPRPPSLVHPGWWDTFDWLVQGTTTRGEGAEPFDLGLFGAGSPTGRVEQRWEELRATTGADKVVHARQVHGRQVRVHDGDGAGLVLVDDADAHLTASPGVLLAVTAADCVPVTLVDPHGPAVGMVHAGWRGVAAGVLSAAVSEMVAAFGSDPAALRLHLGPAICGRCYEVGPEVFLALDLPAPRGPTLIDLREELRRRALTLGVQAEHVTVSAHCTRCTDSRLFSHRGGDPHRHVGYVGIRSSTDGNARAGR